MPQAPRFPLLLAVLLLLAPAAPAWAKDITLPPSGDNQFASVTQGIGLVRVTVEYSSPNVHAPDGHDRTDHVWGELVPYGLHDLQYNNCTECPWRGGANENTVFSVSHPVKIEGQPLPAGAYGLFFIAGEDEWTVIFSKRSNAWGAFWYDPAEDQLRVKVKPVPNEYREWLAYDFDDRETDHTTLSLEWEKLRVPIHISVDDVNGLYVDQIKEEFHDAQSFKWENFRDAARFCLDKNAHLDQGLVWADLAVNDPFNGVENFQTLSTLAQLQAASGKQAESAKTMDRAMAAPDATPIAIHGLARGMQIAGDKEGARRVYLANAKRHGSQWPVNVGLARAAAMSGDHKSAVSYAKKALAQAPDDLNRQNLERLIQQWGASAATTK